jgi:glycerol uptake operon antiterminator
MSGNFVFNNPVIAAVREKEEFLSALSSPAEVVFLLKSSILTLKTYVDAAHKYGKKIFIHTDFTNGIAKDSDGLEFIRQTGADGIISTKAGLIKTASAMGLITVQRVFCVDSQSTQNLENAVQNAMPDMIEIMPGILYKTISDVASSINLPVIAGGLIETKDEIFAALSAGASAISTGKKELWYK